MATTILTNYGDFIGEYLDETDIAATTNTVETTIISGITATKEADKEFWINGPLTYTIKLNNESGETFENVVLTDTLNPALIALDQVYGVYVNDVKTTDYTYVGGLLTVQIGDIETDEEVKVVFQVLQV